MEAPSQPWNDDQPINELANQCLEAFEAVVKICCPGLVDEALSARIEILFKQPEEQGPILTLADLEDDYEQFRVWARNLGVFATDHASLDFRLREASDVREGIASLLTSLKSDINSSKDEVVMIMSVA
jgi:hypothetical protein